MSQMCFSPYKHLIQMLNNVAAMAPLCHVLPYRMDRFVVLFLAFSLLLVGVLARDRTCRRGSRISEVLYGAYCQIHGCDNTSLTPPGFSCVSFLSIDRPHGEGQSPSNLWAY